MASSLSRSSSFVNVPLSLTKEEIAAEKQKKFNTYGLQLAAHDIQNEKYMWKSVALTVVALLSTIALAVGFAHSESSELVQHVEKVAVIGGETTAALAIASIFFKLRRSNFPKFDKWCEENSQNQIKKD